MTHEIEMQLSNACRHGDLEKVKSLIATSHIRMYHINTALIWSVVDGYLDLVKYLIEEGANIRVYRDDALKYAVEDRHLEVVLYLKKIYLEKYGERFLCHNCIVLPICMKLCSDKLVKKR